MEIIDIAVISAGKTVKPSVAIKKLKLVKSQEKIARHPMPYAAKNMFYDERWIEKQERGKITVIIQLSPLLTKTASGLGPIGYGNQQTEQENVEEIGYVHYISNDR